MGGVMTWPRFAGAKSGRPPKSATPSRARPKEGWNIFATIGCRIVCPTVLICLNPAA